MTTKNSIDELIFNIRDDHALRVLFTRLSTDNQLVNFDFCIWVRQETGLFRGLIMETEQRLRRMADRPLNAQQLVRFLREQGYSDNNGTAKYLTDIAVSDLDRTYGHDSTLPSINDMIA